jgi:hypothetical protein
MGIYLILKGNNAKSEHPAVVDSFKAEEAVRFVVFEAVDED